MTTQQIVDEQERIVDRLINARLELGMDQRALARKISACPQTISNIERCEKFPSISTLIRYADAVNLHIELTNRGTPLDHTFQS